MNGTLGVHAAHRFFIKEPADLLKLPLLGCSNASMTFENGTQVPQQPNQGVPSIAYLANITCPVNLSRTNIMNGQPVSIGLDANISDATLFYNYSQDDLTPEKNGTYHLAS